MIRAPAFPQKRTRTSVEIDVKGFLKMKTLRIGLLGCGPISQVAHLDAIRKARNAELYAICDVATDLVERMQQIHQPHKTYISYEAMLADQQVEAVLIAVDDRYHFSLARMALDAGKHVLIEKPLAVTVEECKELVLQVQEAGLILQVGNNRRFHPGWQEGYHFLHSQMGKVMAFAAWYHDSVYRYQEQENLYPILVNSASSKRPAEQWKEIPQRYRLITHGSHLLDTARFFMGEIESIQASLVRAGTMHSWTIDAAFFSGCHGQLRLIAPAHGDFEEGFRIEGEQGSIQGKALLPWFQRATVECFKNGRYTRVLGEDGYTFKRQVEGFADTILGGAPQLGATVEDGLATVQALVAISHSQVLGKRIRLSEVEGGVLTTESE